MMFPLIVLALLGLLDSSYLLLKKLKNEKVVCFLGRDCDTVVKSAYGRILGFPNEALGILFYLGVVGAVLLMAQGREVVLGFSIPDLLRSAGALAFLVSLYLVGVQAFLLKMWCAWCLASALINGIILFLLFS